MLMRSPRARLVGMLSAFALAAGLLAYALTRPGAPPQPRLDLPSLPSIGSASQEPRRSPQPQPEVLVAMGDIGSCDSDADEAVADLVSRLRGTIAVLGDLAYERGSPAEFARCFDPAWGPMKDRIRPAPGNHDYLTDGAAGYYDYFSRAAGTRGKGWYSYDLGAWHLVALNSNCALVGCGPGSPQLDWLRTDLAMADASCLLAYWHHPRWSSGRHGSQAFVQPFWAELERAGIDVILNGHDHTYERVSVRGVAQFVVGTGGRSLYPFTEPPLPTTQARTDRAYGALWLALSPGGYEWRFLALGQSEFRDTGWGSC
jgi:hypothetical protein